MTKSNSPGSIDLSLLNMPTDEDRNLKNPIDLSLRSHIRFSSLMAQVYLEVMPISDVAEAMQEIGFDSFSTRQLLLASKSVDVALEQWRNQPLGDTPCVQLLSFSAPVNVIAHQNKVMTILIALGIKADSTPTVLNINIAHDELETGWRNSIYHLHRRGLSGVKYVLTDHADVPIGLKYKQFTEALWLPCQDALLDKLSQKVINEAQLTEISSTLLIKPSESGLSKSQINFDQFRESYSDEIAAYLGQHQNTFHEASKLAELPAEYQQNMHSISYYRAEINKELSELIPTEQVFPNVDTLRRIYTVALASLSRRWELEPYKLAETSSRISQDHLTKLS